MLYDNKNNGKVGAELKKRISEGTKLSVLSGMFSVYGYQALKKELSKVSDVRLLLSNWHNDSNNSLAGSLSELRLKNQLAVKTVA